MNGITTKETAEKWGARRVRCSYYAPGVAYTELFASEMIGLFLPMRKSQKMAGVRKPSKIAQD